MQYYLLEATARMGFRATMSISMLCRWLHHECSTTFWERKAIATYGPDACTIPDEAIYEAANADTAIPCTAPYRYYVLETVIDVVRADMKCIPTPCWACWDDFICTNVFNISREDMNLLHQCAPTERICSLLDQVFWEPLDVDHAVFKRHMPVLLDLIATYGMNRWFLKDKGEILPPNIQSLIRSILRTPKLRRVRRIHRIIQSMDEPEDIMAFMNAIYVSSHLTIAKSAAIKVLSNSAHRGAYTRRMVRDIDMVHKKRRSIVRGKDAAKRIKSAKTYIALTVLMWDS